jgi:hypothetical protein
LIGSVRPHGVLLLVAFVACVKIRRRCCRRSSTEWGTRRLTGESCSWYLCFVTLVAMPNSTWIGIWFESLICLEQCGIFW